MARIEGSIPDVYSEPHLFDPPSSLLHDDHQQDDDGAIDDEGQEEGAPMLPTTAANTLNHSKKHSQTTYLRGPNNTLKIIFLTICLAGLQFTWTVEMAYGTPYLLSLGLTKSYMSLVWIAGPLSGLIMQPVVGVISDSCKSKWGRRRPFLVGGSVIVIISLFCIGWTREVTSLFTKSESGDTFQTVSIVIAVVSIYILDFSINCVQASCRALIVDSLPHSQQEDGTAWAGRMVGLGNVAGYFMGYTDLVKIFPFFGNTQLKVLCVFAVIVLFLCNCITCYSVREKVMDYNTTRRGRSSLFRLFSDIFRNIWNLPKPIQRICNVQFFAWIGWFPFLFYSTTWVAEIYNRTVLTTVDDSTVLQDQVGQATRAGSLAFLVYSLVSLFSSFLVPLLVAPYSTKEEQQYELLTIKLFGKMIEIHSGILKLSFLTLPRAWTISQFIFCICMVSTLFVNDVTAAAIIIGTCGISWAISMWAPFSLLGEYISKQEALQQHKLYDSQQQEQQQEESFVVHHSHLMASRASLALGMIGEPALYQPTGDPFDDQEEEIEMLGVKKKKKQQQQQQEEEEEGSGGGSGSNQEDETVVEEGETTSAGVLLGIHNMYIVLPQFLVTFFSSIIFRLLDTSKDTLNEAQPRDTIGLILRIGGIMAGIAGFISIKIGG